MTAVNDKACAFAEASLPADASAWIAVASGQARLRLGTVKGPASSGALRLDFDFAGGGGFVVARCEVPLVFPESWELLLMVRGEAPANTLEVKFVDEAGTSAWRWLRQGFAPPAQWQELRVASHEAPFAWGPAGGGSIGRASAVEVAVVAPPGGEGFLEIAGFQLIDRSAKRALSAAASSQAASTSPSMAVDGDDSTRWLSEPGPGPHELLLDLGEERDVGGLVVRWDPSARPLAFRVDAKREGGPWQTCYQASRAGSGTNFLDLAGLRAAELRVTATATAAGVGVAAVEVKPLEWSSSASEFLTRVALAGPRGLWPRYLLREQTWWTPLASPDSGPVGLLSDDGAVEAGEGGFLLEPSLLVRSKGAAPDWQRVTWADVERSVSLEEAPLPVPTALWRWQGITLEISGVVEEGEEAATLLLRYRVAQSVGPSMEVRLCVALRPLQVTPPWQAFRGLGGPSPIVSIDGDRHGATVNGSVSVEAVTAASAFGVASFDEGGAAALVADASSSWPGSIEDPRGRAEGVFVFDTVAGGEGTEAVTTPVYLQCRLPRRGRAGVLRREATGSAAPSRFAAALERWRAAVPLFTAEGCEEFRSARGGAVTAVAHILACRDGVALQPGPRRYTRSWIRDGAIMAAALAGAGRVDAARDFALWYAPFQREDGFVPCCVDRDGVDPLVEHDSHGQWIHAVAETHRFLADREFLAGLWPSCAKAAVFLESLRATRKTDEFRRGPRAACFGLLPESVSHEGYLAQPVHSYWDDFWALRGFRDAAFLAAELGLGDEAARWEAAAVDLGEAIAASMLAVMKDRDLRTVPASVEWADFDPTAVAGAISLVGAAELFPASALQRTFDQYLEGFRARRDGRVVWNNSSPYEVRIVGALVRLGRRDDANEVLDFLLATRRPVAWGQWPEIAWRNPEAPAHLGDLPHCWIGAEYVIALRTMLVYERERDGALVIGAGLRRAWLDAPGGISAKGVATWYGSVDVSIRREGSGSYRVVVGGSAKPPGGFVAALPENCKAVIERS